MGALMKDLSFDELLAMSSVAPRPRRRRLPNPVYTPRVGQCDDMTDRDWKAVDRLIRSVPKMDDAADDPDPDEEIDWRV
jgi:hypothetical protein